MPVQLRAVTFDLDGLMFNTENLYQDLDTELLARRGKRPTEELFAQMMGRKTEHALQIMIDWHKLDDTVEGLVAESVDIMARLLENSLEPMPGLLGLLDALESAGIPKAIATSSSRVFAEKVLARSGLDSRMRFVLTSENIEHGKPEPDVYLLAAEKHGVAPAEMMVLEDSQIGCAAAVAAGTYVIAVPAGLSHRHTFEGVCFKADSLADGRILAALGISPAS